MWYVVPVDRKWVEIRESRNRPIKITHRLNFGDGLITQYINTHKGGVCRAVVRGTHFMEKTGRTPWVLKKIPASEAQLFID